MMASGLARTTAALSAARRRLATHDGNAMTDAAARPVPPGVRGAPNGAVATKVPPVTVLFWIIKILCTTVGETASNFLSVKLGHGLKRTAVAAAGAREPVGNRDRVTRFLPVPGCGRSVLLRGDGDSVEACEERLRGRRVRDCRGSRRTRPPASSRLRVIYLRGLRVATTMFVLALAAGRPVRVGDGSEYYALFLAWRAGGRPFMTDAAWAAYEALYAGRSVDGLVAPHDLVRAFPALVQGATADFNHFWFYSGAAAAL